MTVTLSRDEILQAVALYLERRGFEVDMTNLRLETIYAGTSVMTVRAILEGATLPPSEGPYR